MYYKPFYGHIFARLFATTIHFHPSLIFAILKPTRVEPTEGFHSNSLLLALTAKIMAVANTLAYCNSATITAVKSFTVEPLGLVL